MLTRRSLLLSSLALAPMRGATPPAGLCLSTYGMKELSLETALRTIADAGYDGVELALIPGWQTDPAKMSAQDRADLRALLRKTRLTVAALNDQLPITSDSRAHNAARLKLAADLAIELASDRPPVIETMLGGKTDEWPAVKARIAEELRTWAEIAESRKVTVCFKPHAGHAIHNPARAFEMLRLVNSSRLKVCYDYCHMFVAKEPLGSSLRELAPHTGFITLKDARWTDQGYEFLLPGDGDTDYPLYFRLLKELGYSGWVGVEVSAMVFRKPGYDPRASARKAYAKIAPLWKAADLPRPQFFDNTNRPSK